MEEIAKRILEKMEKLTFDNMDNFDKFDFFRNEIEDDINFLCSQIENKEPTVVNDVSDNEIDKVESNILKDYHDNSEVVIGEMLSNVGVNNISLEKAASLYASLMNEVEGDLIVQIYNNSISETDLDELGDYRKL